MATVCRGEEAGVFTGSIKETDLVVTSIVRGKEMRVGLAGLEAGHYAGAGSLHREQGEKFPDFGSKPKQIFLKNGGKIFYQGFFFFLFSPGLRFQGW